MFAINDDRDDAAPIPGAYCDDEKLPIKKVGGQILVQAEDSDRYISATRSPLFADDDDVKVKGNKISLASQFSSPPLAVKNATPLMMPPMPDALRSTSSSAARNDVCAIDSPSAGQPEGEITVRPTPRSMLPSSWRSFSRQAPSKVPSVPVLEATLVEEKPEVPVYDAVEVSVVDDGPPPFWRKHHRCIFIGMFIIIGIFL